MDHDEYPTCARTYATLRIYPGDLDPAAVTERLGIEPSRWQRRGDPLPPGRLPKVAPLGGWFLTSKGRVESRDSRRHIDWLLDQVEPRAEVIGALRAEGCRIDVTCYWVSRYGHGGPIVPAPQMRRLSELGVDLSFDFYGPCEESDG